MSEVVIERPRRGSRHMRFHDSRVRYKGMDVEALDDLPKKQGYIRPHKESGSYKTQSDLLGPLRNFLISRIGHRWDDVYSEIRANINPKSTIQLHILSHIDHYVETKILIGTDGKLWTGDKYCPRHIRPGDLYVHPETGILTEMPPRQRTYVLGYDKAVETLREIFGNGWHTLFREQRYAPIVKYYSPPIIRWEHRVIAEAKKHKLVGFEQELHKIGGIWYWVIFTDAPSPWHWIDASGTTHTTDRGATDMITGKTVMAGGRFRADKRQANRRDLRRYRLQND